MNTYPYILAMRADSADPTYRTVDRYPTVADARRAMERHLVAKPGIGRRIILFRHRRFYAAFSPDAAGVWAREES